MLTVVDDDTEVVLTVNVALVAPPGTVTLAGTLATEGLLLESKTTAPALEAGPLSVAAPVEELPPVTLEGLTVNEESVGVTPVPGFPSSTETVRAWRLATARSGAESPLKSLTVTYTGSLSTVKLCAVWKVPSPLPSSTETVLKRWLVTTRSSLPSRLKS